MKKIAALLVLIAGTAYAGSGSLGYDAGIQRVESVSGSERTICVSLIVPADCLTVLVSIESDEVDVDRRITELMAADALLRTNLPSHVSINNISTCDIVSTQIQAPARGTGREITRLTREMVYPLGKETSELEIIRDAHALIRKIVWPGRTTGRVSVQSLGIKDSERYRSNMLELVAQDVKKVRALFGDKTTVHLKNLQAPITVAEHSDSSVEIFLNYTMDIVLEK